MLAPFTKDSSSTTTANTSNSTISKDDSPNSALVLAKYAVAKTRVGIRQLTRVASSASAHLPPAVAPLVLLALLPVPPDVHRWHIYTKRLALATMGISIVSWAHCELRKFQRLTALPLSIEFSEEYATVLPPFLPEQPMKVPNEFELLSKGNEIEESLGNGNVNGTSWQTQYLRQLTHTVKTSPRTVTNFVGDWKRQRQLKHYEAQVSKRIKIMEELMAFQKLRTKLRPKRNSRPHRILLKPSDLKHEQSKEEEEIPLGWAMVTGASRGIGRAFAVELARWDIPVILVARDAQRLQELSQELQQCYGIPCCVVQADLTKPGADERLYATTQAAGMHVDILINNAGISSSGDVVDTDIGQMNAMVDVNVRSVTQLSRWYGKDMQRRGRGRIVFVSSITGAFPGVPGSAVYAATKAYQRSLAMGLGKELERHGVGVTCVTPGAVKGTNFASQGNMDDALCWKYPFYAMTAPHVASRGVRAMLRGDTEVIPGVQNRLWLRIVQPLLPPRVSMLVAETSWKPLHLQLPWSSKANPEALQDDSQLPTFEKPNKFHPGFMSIDDYNPKEETPSPDSPTKEEDPVEVELESSIPESELIDPDEGIPVEEAPTMAAETEPQHNEPSPSAPAPEEATEATNATNNIMAAPRLNRSYTEDLELRYEMLPY